MSTRRQRVIALCNAISDLHRGDLHAVLMLDRQVPLPDDISIEGHDPPPLALVGRAVKTGEKLGQMLEDQLVSIMAFGETYLNGVPKRDRRGQLGGRRFV